MKRRTISIIIITLMLSFTYSTFVSAKDYRLVKTSNDAKVFLVKENRRVHIPNEEVFESGGYKWNEIEIISEWEISTIPNTALIKSPVDAKVYVMKNGKKEHIPNEMEFLGAGYSWGDIVLISQA